MRGPGAQPQRWGGGGGGGDDRAVKPPVNIFFTFLKKKKSKNYLIYIYIFFVLKLSESCTKQRLQSAFFEGEGGGGVGGSADHSLGNTQNF